MSPMDDERAALAEEAWASMLDFFSATASQRTDALAELGLSVNDSRALTTLDADRGRPMGALAETWSCDASTATWIVDRLERRGLVARFAEERDRRLRLVVLTAAGVAVRDEMLRRMYRPPAELLSLSTAELAGLREGVARLRDALARRG
jgi:DNA-binding MarR family transcriptional regulator